MLRSTTNQDAQGCVNKNVNYILHDIYFTCSDFQGFPSMTRGCCTRNRTMPEEVLLHRHPVSKKGTYHQYMVEETKIKENNVHAF